MRFDAIDEAEARMKDAGAVALTRYFSNGDQTAFAEVFERYSRLVYRMCLGRLGRREAAQDATQAVFLLLSRKGSGLQDERALTAWLDRSSRFICMHIRRTEPKWEPIEDERPNLESSPNLSLKYVSLYAALDKLSSADREILRLRYVQGFAVAEVATTLSISTGSAQMRLSRALDRLRRTLKRTAPELASGCLAMLMDGPDSTDFRARFAPTDRAVWLANSVRAPLWTPVVIVPATAAGVLVVAGAVWFAAKPSNRPSGGPNVELARLLEGDYVGKSEVLDRMSGKYFASQVTGRIWLSESGREVDFTFRTLDPPGQDSGAFRFDGDAGEMTSSSGARSPARRTSDGVTVSTSRMDPMTGSTIPIRIVVRAQSAGIAITTTEGDRGLVTETRTLARINAK